MGVNGNCLVVIDYLVYRGDLTHHPKHERFRDSLTMKAPLALIGLVEKALPFGGEVAIP